MQNSGGRKRFHRPTLNSKEQMKHSGIVLLETNTGASCEISNFVQDTNFALKISKLHHKIGVETTRGFSF